jgi:hypothetical protein
MIMHSGRATWNPARPRSRDCYTAFLLRAAHFGIPNHPWVYEERQNSVNTNFLNRFTDVDKYKSGSCSKVNDNSEKMSVL